MTLYEQALRDAGVKHRPGPGLREDCGFLAGYQLVDLERGVPGVDIRSKFIRGFGFAIPDDDALLVVARYGPIIEVGAGAGYWAYELEALGVDVIATDIEPVPSAGRQEGGMRFERQWHPVVAMDATTAAKIYPYRTLMLIWPSYAQPWAAEALEVYAGKRVIYVGEATGGCCADPRFDELLEARFEVEAAHRIPQWLGLHDRLTVWRRK